jgi:hypothetical protein
VRYRETAVSGTITALEYGSSDQTPEPAELSLTRPPSDQPEQDLPADFTAHLVARYGLSREAAEAELGELLVEYWLGRCKRIQSMKEADRSQRDSGAARWTPVPVH